jgi:acyl-CoA reductase-like NAD-dependent aldehyde dehydrogenase
MASPTSQTTITPHNQKSLVTLTYVSQSELDDVIKRSSVTQKAWARVPLKDRLAIVTNFVVRTHSQIHLAVSKPCGGHILGRVPENE